MKFCNLVLSGIALSSVPNLAVASTQASPRYDVIAFDIAGIELGMKPAEVEEIFRDQGFSVKTEREALTYSVLVERKAVQLRQPAPKVAPSDRIGKMHGKDSAGNALEVKFLSTATGPIAAAISIDFDENTNSIPAVQQDIRARYGAPSRVMLASNGDHWCTPTDDDCDLGDSRNAPKLSFKPAGIWNTLELSALRFWKAQRDAEIENLFSAPSVDRQRSLLGGN